MVLSDRQGVPDHEGKRVFKQNLASTELAKWTAWISKRIGCSDRPKVRIVGVTLHRIAGVAKCLQVARIIGPAVIAWHYMVYL
jgi:hypothetical protein